MQIGHPFPGMAAEFAQIMSGGTAGYQGQIHGNAGFFQRPSHGHSDVVHAGNVLQSPIGRGLQPQSHHFIYIFPLPQPQHLTVARSAGAVLQLLFPRKGKVPHGVKGEQLLLRGKEHLQHRQQKHGARSAGGIRPRLGEEKPPCKVIGIAEPALVGLLGTKLLQLFPAQLQHTFAAESLLPQQRGKALHKVFLFQSLQKSLPVLKELRRRALMQPAQQKRIHLPYPLSVHGYAPCIRKLLLYSCYHSPPAL